MNLKSTVNKLGKRVTQVFHFKGNVVRTFEHILPETIKDGMLVKMMTEDGRMLMINRDNVLMVEVFPEDNIIDKTK